MDLKDRSGVYFKFLTYIVTLVLINVAGITLFFRFDLTENRIYSISEASQKVVSTLSEPLTVNVFFTKNLPAPHNNTERYLHDLLEEYAIKANQHFNFRFYDVNPDEGVDIGEKERANQELAKSYGIHPIQIQIIEEDEVKFQKAYMGLALIHGDMIERISTITSTDGLEYRLTTTIQKLNNKISALLRLTDPIKIKLFLSTSLETVAPFMGLESLPELSDALKETVEDLNTKSYGKLEFSYLDPSKDPALKKELEKYNIITLGWPDIPEKNLKADEGAIGLIMENGDRVLEIPLINVSRNPLFGTQYELIAFEEMEEAINKGMESLIDINEDLGYVSNRGTLSLNSNPNAAAMGQNPYAASNLRTLASQTYNINSLDLEDEVIPESLNCLIVAGPKETFTDYELFQIDQFLMKGKNLAIFVDSLKAADPNAPPPPGYDENSNYIPLETGLEKLLAHYGINLERSYVFDENCFKQKLPESYGGGEQTIYFAPLILNDNINKDLAMMKNINGLVVSQIAPLTLNEQRIKENNIQAHKLFSSSDRSWEMKKWIELNPMYMRPPGPDQEMKSMPLAYLLEGAFSSYFADKPIPEKVVKKDEKDSEDAEGGNEVKRPDIDLSKIKDKSTLLSKGKPGKIFLVGTSEILKDNIIDQEGRSRNAIFTMNLIDYMNDRESTATMRSKENRFNPLIMMSAGLKTFVKAFNIVGLPIIVIIFGLAIWYRRHIRKKQIQSTFQKS
ncbi:GldG family protein [Thermodesulfobacteriota bacterium]